MSMRSKSYIHIEKIKDGEIGMNVKGKGEDIVRMFVLGTIDFIKSSLNDESDFIEAIDGYSEILKMEAVNLEKSRAGCEPNSRPQKTT